MKVSKDYNANRRGIYIGETERAQMEIVGAYWERQGVSLRYKGQFAPAKIFSLLLAREALRIQEEEERLHK